MRSDSGLHHVGIDDIVNPMLKNMTDNYPEPGKRPLSSTVPTILENSDGSFYLAVGGSGGSRIFGAVFQVLMNLEWGLDVSQAIEYGRLHNQLYPEELDADDVYPQGILEGLRKLGHRVTGKQTVRER